LKLHKQRAGFFFLETRRIKLLHLNAGLFGWRHIENVGHIPSQEFLPVLGVGFSSQVESWTSTLNWGVDLVNQAHNFL